MVNLGGGECCPNDRETKHGSVAQALHARCFDFCGSETFSANFGNLAMMPHVPVIDDRCTNVFVVALVLRSEIQFY